MYEESIRFFTDLFQNDGSVLEILDADYTFLNEPAGEALRHPGRRRARSGGASTASRSMAAAASSARRRRWRSNPARRAPARSCAATGSAKSCSARSCRGRRRTCRRCPTTKRHRGADRPAARREAHQRPKRCAVCHARIDPFGFSLEAFRRDRPPSRKGPGRPADRRPREVQWTAPKFDGLDGLRNYLLTKRRDAFLRQFCRKLLGYALGRAVQLSDEPLLDGDAGASWPRTTIAWAPPSRRSSRSRQFREIRGT